MESIMEWLEKKSDLQPQQMLLQNGIAEQVDIDIIRKSSLVPGCDNTKDIALIDSRLFICYNDWQNIWD